MRATPASKPAPEMRLYDDHGHRLYLNQDERGRFCGAVARQPAEVRTFCRMLLYTGCRVSEALALTPASVHISRGLVQIRTLKQRNRVKVRLVPVPPEFIDELAAMFDLIEAQRDPMRSSTPLWPFSRCTAWRRVKEIMCQAGVHGPQATPKGLRHGFGVHAISVGVQLNMVKRWMGHAKLSTTAIYTDAIGPEEHLIAMQMWGRS